MNFLGCGIIEMWLFGGGVHFADEILLLLCHYLDGTCFCQILTWFTHCVLSTTQLLFKSKYEYFRFFGFKFLLKCIKVAHISPYRSWDMSCQRWSSNKKWLIQPLQILWPLVTSVMGLINFLHFEHYSSFYLFKHQSKMTLHH